MQGLAKDPIHQDSKKIPHQPETEWVGEIQKFTSPALSPEETGPRVRLGRPRGINSQSSDQKQRPSKSE
jgi:hypothetical protein